MLAAVPFRPHCAWCVHAGATFDWRGRYLRMLPLGSDRVQDTDMKRRILAMFLWFYAWWYAGAIIADAFGFSPLIGPLIGAAAAALIVANPRTIIWSDTGIQRARAKERLVA